MPLPDLPQILSTSPVVPANNGTPPPVPPADRSEYLEALSRSVREKPTRSASSADEKKTSAAVRPAQRDRSTTRRLSEERQARRQNTQRSASAASPSPREKTDNTGTSRSSTAETDHSVAPETQPANAAASKSEPAQQTNDKPADQNTSLNSPNAAQDSSEVPENLAAVPPAHIAELFEEAASSEGVSAGMETDELPRNENNGNDEPRPPAGLVNVLRGQAASVQTALPAQTGNAEADTENPVANPLPVTDAGDAPPLEDLPLPATDETAEAGDGANRSSANARPSDTETSPVSVVDFTDAGSTPSPQPAETTSSGKTSHDKKTAEKTDEQAGTAPASPAGTPGTTAVAATPGSGRSTADAGSEGRPFASAVSAAGDGSAFSTTAASPSSTGGTSPLSAGSENSASSSPVSQGETGSADPVRNQFAQRVVEAVRSAVSGQRSFRVRLQPPELGVLQVEISREDGLLIARLEVQTTAARQALTDNLAHLKASLQRHGVSLDRVEIQLDQTRREETSGQSHHGQSQYQQSDQQYQHPRDTPDHHSASGEDEERGGTPPAGNDIPPAEGAETTGRTANPLVREDDLDVQI